jgi:RecB family endonuclease NucS
VEEIRLWRIVGEGTNKPSAAEVKSVVQTDTEQLLEEVLTHTPDVLMPGLRLIGRQTETPGGPLDLLGIDGDGRLVVFELKRGTLTRDAVAQVIDYASYLADLQPEELNRHITCEFSRNTDQVSGSLIT